MENFTTEELQIELARRLEILTIEGDGYNLDIEKYGSSVLIKSGLDSWSIAGLDLYTLKNMVDSALEGQSYEMGSFLQKFRTCKEGL
jgi:hypothetical protein